jgi:hypothetical protein
MKTPILGQSYVVRSVNAADNRMVNLFPEATPDVGKDVGFLSRAPGLSLLATIGTGPVRGLWTFGVYGYVVSGNSLYRVDSSWRYVFLGLVTGSGPVSMTDNGVQLFVACNPDGFIYNVNTNVFAQITDPDFAGAGSVGYLDGYFVFNEPNSQKIWVTSLYDGLSVDPLDFASAEGSPDNIVSLMVDHREVWLFGTTSVEVWYNAGTPDFPLQRIQGAYNEIGCAAAYSVVKLDNSLFWLGADARGRGVVYQAKGYKGVRVSTHAIEYAIQNYGTISDAIGYSYQQDGHAFYVLTFPTANATWVYDAATQMWHERAGWYNGAFTRHRSNCQMSFANEIVVGDYQTGNLYAFSLTDYSDNGDIQKWLRSWRALPTGQNTLKRTAQHSLQLDAETGVGLNEYPAYASEDLITEDGKNLIVEYVQYAIATESDEALTTEDADQNEVLVTIANYPQPYVAGTFLSTTSYPASPGYTPMAMLRWSDDGGHTWSSEHWRSMGKIGTFGHRTFWRRLGMTLKLRDRVYEVSGTDPVKIIIMGAELHASATNA